MAKPTAPTTFPWHSKNALVSDDFLALFHERFARYRTSKERERLLAGISPDKQHGRMTVRSAAILVCCLSASREWRTSEGRLRHYRDARWRSEQHPRSRARFYDVEKIRKQMTLSEINRIEALVALSFSHQAGYETHSRTLWRCIEAAICTDGLGDPPRVVNSRDDVDELFEKIRLRLYHQRKLKGEAAVTEEAKAIYREFLLRLRNKAWKDPRDQLLLNAPHRRV